MIDTALLGIMTPFCLIVTISLSRDGHKLLQSGLRQFCFDLQQVGLRIRRAVLIFTWSENDSLNYLEPQTKVKDIPRVDITKKRLKVKAANRNADDLTHPFARHYSIVKDLRLK